MSVIDVSLLICAIALAAFVGVQCVKLVKAIKAKRAKRSHTERPEDVSLEDKKGE